MSDTNTTGYVCERPHCKWSGSESIGDERYCLRHYNEAMAPARIREHLYDAGLAIQRAQTAAECLPANDHLRTAVERMFQGHRGASAIARERAPELDRSHMVMALAAENRAQHGDYWEVE